MRITFLTLLTTLLSTISQAQENKFTHCNCIETSTKESYKVVSNGIDVESGKFKSGKRTGLWTSKNSKGITIRKANYTNGKLDGSYELFHFDSTPKLTAEFEGGKPTGTWSYYNAKGKVIKQGSFSGNKPTGAWKIMDKKGKKVYAEYNFDSMSEIVSPNGKQYFQKGGVIRDDQSGEWMVLYLPTRDIRVETQPIGGYMLSSDLFVGYFNVPTILMNTYTHFEFNTIVKIENGITSITSVHLLENKERFDINSHSLPFMVDTNPPSKLSRIKHSEATINFLKDQLAEYVLITAPWVTNAKSEEIIIRTPIVINEVKRW